MRLGRGRSGRWLVSVVAAVGCLTLAGVHGAYAEPRDSFPGLLGAGVAVEPDGAEQRLLDPAREPWEHQGAGPADPGSAREAAQAAGSETPSGAADRRRAPGDAEQEPGGDYDPWEPFNDRTFAFNHDVLDGFVLKPAATAWDKVLPDPVQRSLGRAFDNLGMPRRVVNHLLQRRPQAAGLELTRFLFNTTLGIAGFFDVAKAMGIEKSDADTGQTLGLYGAGPGPYVIVPFLPPLTIRDGIGFGIDSVLDPLGYFIPFLASLGMTAGKTVNERSVNLQLFQDVEDSVLDLYSAVRNGYLQRRHKLIEDRRAEIGREIEVVLQQEPDRDPPGWLRH